MTRFFAACAALAGLSACVPTTPPTYLTAPADPRLQLRSPGYTTVTAGVQKFDVVDPKDWREMNRAVGPQSGQGGGATEGTGVGDRKRDTGGR